MIRWDRFIVEILHSVEGRDVEQGCSNPEINLPCLRLLSLSLTCVYILHAFIVHIHYLLDIYYAYIDICLGIVCSHLYSIKKAIAAPQLLSRGIFRDSPEPVTGNSATLLGLSLIHI